MFPFRGTGECWSSPRVARPVFGGKVGFLSQPGMEPDVETAARFVMQCRIPERMQQAAPCVIWRILPRGGVSPAGDSETSERLEKCNVCSWRPSRRWCAACICHSCVSRASRGAVDLHDLVRQGYEAALGARDLHSHISAGIGSAARSTRPRGGLVLAQPAETGRLCVPIREYMR